MFEKILVPIDGSETSNRGFEQAVDLASALKARLVVLHVVNDLALLLDSAGQADTVGEHDANMRAGKELVAAAGKAAAAKGVECDRAVLDARSEATADVICREAESRQCHLIVMGTHGRRGWKRLTLGSNADLVVRQASMPVMLVRHAGSAAE